MEQDQRPFIEQLWQRGRPLLRKMTEHPFNRELAAGTLPLETFAHYLQQDEFYLRDYTRALQLLAGRTGDEVLRRDLELYVSDGLALEQAMHQDFFVRYQIASAPCRTQAGTLYGRFLLNNVQQESIAVGLAALLPCFWFYWKVGQQLLTESVRNNPYQAWIDTYSGSEFRRQVETLLDHVEACAQKAKGAECKLMADTFMVSAQLELVFWQTIYAYPQVRKFSQKPLLSAQG